MTKHSAITILRWGLAFIFFYAAISSLLNPENWVGYFPDFLINLLPDKFVFIAFSFYEIVLAAMLFFGKKIAWASLFAAITLVGITIFNLNTLDVVFRDIGLIFMALALHELIREERSLKEVLIEEMKNGNSEI